MTENEYWAKFWKIIGTTVCLLSIVIASCSNAVNCKDNEAMVEMVAKGADPLDARCAIKNTEGAVCSVRAAIKNK